MPTRSPVDTPGPGSPKRFRTSALVAVRGKPAGYGSLPAARMAATFASRIRICSGRPLVRSGRPAARSGGPLVCSARPLAPVSSAVICRGYRRAAAGGDTVTAGGGGWRRRLAAAADNGGWQLTRRAVTGPAADGPAVIALGVGGVALKHQPQADQGQPWLVRVDHAHLIDDQRREAAGSDDGDRVRVGGGELGRHPPGDPLDLAGEPEDDARLQRLDRILADHVIRTGQL